MFKSLKNAITNAASTSRVNTSTASGPLIKNILVSSGTQTPAMNYHMSTIRWHLDTRQHVSLLLLHDFGSHPNSWSQFNIAAATLPKKGLTPTVPMNLYMPHLCNHGDGAQMANASIGDYVKDVVTFANEVILPTSPVHIVGLGFGARVGLLAALSNPARIQSVTAIMHGNPFGSSNISVSHFELLKQLVGECKSLAELNARLAEVVVNDTERINLLFNVKETRSPQGKKLALTLNASGDCSPHTSLSRWPELRNEDGSKGEAHEVCAKLKEHTGGIKCHIIKSSLGGATSCDRTVLQSLFAKHEVSEIPANLSLGMIRKEDTEVVLHKVLDKIGLIGSMAESSIEGAKTAAAIEGL